MAKGYAALLWSVEAHARLRTGRSFRKLPAERRFKLGRGCAVGIADLDQPGARHGHGMRAVWLDAREVGLGEPGCRCGLRRWR